MNDLLKHGLYNNLGYLLTFKLQKIWTWRQRQSQTNYGNTYCCSIQENHIKQTYYKSSNKCIRKSSLAMIFILKFSFSYKFFISQFCLFLSFFESQVLLNVSLVAKCDTLIRTLHLFQCPSITLWSQRIKDRYRVSPRWWIQRKYANTWFAITRRKRGKITSVSVGSAHCIE